MIRIERKSPPELFFRNNFQVEIEILLRISKEEAEVRNLNRSFKVKIGDSEIRRFRNPIIRSAKEKLAIDFHYKCAYCESRTEGELDHFRPKSSARGLNGEFSFEHYWWLEYEWRNMYHVCSTCNRNKATWFPIEGKRIETETPYEIYLVKITFL